MARVWNSLAENRRLRLERAAAVSGIAGKLCPADAATALLEAILEPGDRVCLEGNNQKQADFLAAALVGCDSGRVHDLHMVQSVLALPEHLEVFERGLARRLDFSFSGPQAGRLAELLAAGKIELGAIHTYLELFARYFVDLTPRVALVAAVAADRAGNLYTGPNTEDTPVVIEATAFKNGIVIAQVNEIVDALPRVDIPADWVDFVVPGPKPFFVEPLFTRDPALITEIQVLMAMMVIKGIYAPYEVRRLNHGIGFDAAAIELLLPTFGERLGLRGKICTHWALNPHPTLIPAIESGFVESVHSFGSELGMEDYVAARPDVFFTGPDGSLRSNRAFSQAAGHYACDLFIGSTLQIDLGGNSSTATKDRITGFGGAPNMGADPRGRRHVTPAFLKAGQESYGNFRPQISQNPSVLEKNLQPDSSPENLRKSANHSPMPRGRKLVVQIVETFRAGMKPAFVERLDAWDLAEGAGLELPPVMIYGDDVTHIVTEEGIAHLLRCDTPAERAAAIRAVAGYTPVGRARNRATTEDLRRRGIVQRVDDLGIDPREATREALAARSMKDLVRWSGGLYQPPKRFRNW